MTTPLEAPTSRGRPVVLVTGMPRSGTTAVGSVLASSRGGASFYEPLNPISGLYSVSEWFVFPDGDGAKVPLDRLVSQVLAVDLRLRAGLWDADPWHRKMLKRFSGSRTRFSGLRCRCDPRVRTIVWKDPSASFLAPELALRRGFPTVVTIRSPGASAASFKRLGWGFDVARIQRKLHALTPDAAYLDLDLSALDLDDPAVNAAVLWRLLYGYLDQELPEVGGPLWASGGELVASPRETYQRLFAGVGLEMDSEALSHIDAEYQDRGNSRPDARRAHDRKRNVTQVNEYWKDTLTPQERSRVEALTADVRGSVEERRTGPL